MSDKNEIDDPLDRLSCEVVTLCHNLVINSNVSDEAELHNIVISRLDELVRCAFDIPESDPVTPMPPEVKEALLELASDCFAAALKSRMPNS